MTGPDLPLFMSDRHVEALNRRLAESQPVARLCAGLERDLSLLYKLHDGPEGAEVWWRMEFTRSRGIEFSLQCGAASPDVVITGDYWEVMAGLQGKGPRPLPQGHPDDIEQVVSLLTSQEVRACSVPVVFPNRPVTKEKM